MAPAAEAIAHAMLDDPKVAWAVPEADIRVATLRLLMAASIERAIEQGVVHAVDSRDPELSSVRPRTCGGWRRIRVDEQVSRHRAEAFDVQRALLECVGIAH